MGWVISCHDVVYRVHLSLSCFPGTGTLNPGVMCKNVSFVPASRSRAPPWVTRESSNRRPMRLVPKMLATLLAFTSPGTPGAR